MPNFFTLRFSGMRQIYRCTPSTRRCTGDSGNMLCSPVVYRLHSYRIPHKFTTLLTDQR